MSASRHISHLGQSFDPHHKSDLLLRLHNSHSILIPAGSWWLLLLIHDWYEYITSSWHLEHHRRAAALSGFPALNERMLRSDLCIGPFKLNENCLEPATIAVVVIRARVCGLGVEVWCPIGFLEGRPRRQARVRVRTYVAHLPDAACTVYANRQPNGLADTASSQIQSSLSSVRCFGQGGCELRKRPGNHSSTW